jgi:excisionase family DNA binding protein
MHNRLKLEEVNMVLTFMRKSETKALPVASPPKSLMSVREAANYCKVSTTTIRRAIKSGHLQIYRAGKQIRIYEPDLVKYLSQ